MAGQSVTRDAAIMFTDLRGFTKASATLSAADLIALIAEYQNVVLPVVRAHGGNIEVHGRWHPCQPSARCARRRPMPGRCIALHRCDFGHPHARGRDREARALPALGSGIGVAHGPPRSRHPGVERRREYAVIGETVNSAKLESTTR
jgi:adenylate cyclase